MEAHRIAVISDTHGILHQEVIEQVKGCEAVLHAGDFDRPEVLEQLREICPTYGVRGNVDKDWAGELPETLEKELFGFRIYMIHNRKMMPKDLPECDIAVFGHSHKYEENRIAGTLYLNPGSCGRRRFRLPLTMAVLTLYPSAHEIKIERIELAPMSSGQAGKTDMGLSKKDMHRLIKAVMKEMDGGRAVADIAARNQVDEALVEQICRMYATHPGVDVDGILDRIERRNL